ncbi:MAG: hypothetical protein ACI86M_000737 [Saprospiraceae bacterium]
MILNSEVYEVSKDVRMKNEELKTEVGEIRGFRMIPTGGISVQTDLNGETGNANINLISKKDPKF